MFWANHEFIWEEIQKIKGNHETISAQIHIPQWASQPRCRLSWSCSSSPRSPPCPPPPMTLPVTWPSPPTLRRRRRWGPLGTWAMILGGKSGTCCWKSSEIFVSDRRSKLTAFLLSLFVGGLGVDWFYLSLGSGQNLGSEVKVSKSCVE